MKSDLHEQFITTLEKNLPNSQSISAFCSKSGIDAACLSRFRNGKAAFIKPDNLRLILGAIPKGSRACVTAAYLRTQVPSLPGCEVFVSCEAPSPVSEANVGGKARRKPLRK